MSESVDGQPPKLVIPERKHSVLAQALANSIAANVSNVARGESEPLIAGDAGGIITSAFAVDDLAANKFDRYELQNSKVCDHYSGYTVSEMLSAVIARARRGESGELVAFRDKVARLFSAAMFAGLPDGYELDDGFSAFLAAVVEDDSLVELGFNAELPYVKASGADGDALFDEFFDPVWNLGDIVEAFTGGAVILPALYEEYGDDLESAGVTREGDVVVFSRRSFVLAIKFVSEAAVFMPFHQVCSGGCVVYDCSPSRVSCARDAKVIPMDAVRRMPPFDTAVILCESNHWGDDVFDLVEECVSMGKIASRDDNVLVALTNKVEEMEHKTIEMFADLGMEMVATVSVNADDIYPGYQRYGRAASFTRRVRNGSRWEYIGDAPSFNMLSDGYYAGMLVSKLAELATTRVDGDVTEVCDSNALSGYLVDRYERVIRDFSFGAVGGYDMPDVKWFQFDEDCRERYFQQYKYLSENDGIQLGTAGILFYDLYDAYKEMYPSPVYQGTDIITYCPTVVELDAMFTSFLEKVRESGFKGRIELVCASALAEMGQAEGGDASLYDDDKEIFYTDDDDYGGGGMMQSIWRVSKPSSHHVPKKGGKKGGRKR